MLLWHFTVTDYLYEILHVDWLGELPMHRAAHWAVDDGPESIRLVGLKNEALELHSGLLRIYPEEKARELCFVNLNHGYMTGTTPDLIPYATRK